MENTEVKEVKEKKKMSRFKKGLIIYGLVLLVLISGLLVYFWQFIGAYEDAMPYNVMDKEIKGFDAGKIEEYIDFDSFDVNYDFVSKEKIIEFVKSKIKGEITYIEAKENTDKNPVYELKAEGETFAKVFLEENGVDGFDYTQWKVKEYDFSCLKPETHSVTVQTIAGAKVYLDGQEVDSKYITEEDITVEKLSVVSEYLTSTPTYVKYEINGLTDKMEVTSKGADDVELPVTVDKNTYSFTFAENNEFEKEILPYVENVNELYAKFFANSGWDIYNYVLDDSKVDTNLELSTTYFYPSEYISGMGFTSREFSEFVKYSDECFSCRVDYVFEVYFKGYYTDKEVTENDMYMIFVKKDGKWLFADFIYN